MELVASGREAAELSPEAAAEHRSRGGRPRCWRAVLRELDMPLAANVREIIGSVTGLGRLLTTRRVILLKKRTSKASWDGWLMTRPAPVFPALALPGLRIFGAICRTL